MSELEDTSNMSKISTLIPNELNEKIILSIVSKTESTFNSIRYNTLFYDGDEYITCQLYNDDLFRLNNVGDVITLEKFIVLTSVDNKGVLPFNSNGYRLENTSVSKIKITKNTIKIKENIFNSIEKISNYETGVAKVFTSLQGIVLNKSTSCPNNKIMVKYEIINEVYDTGIHFLVWSNDVILDENTLYVFKYITVDKYNDGWQLSLNPFTALEKIKKITKIKISSSFTHWSRNSSSSFLYSSYDSFYFNSNGNINCKVLNVVKKKESTF
jgi:hypothetical protein